MYGGEGDFDAESSDLDLPKIIAFRNRLIHKYAEISDEVVWAVATDDVPKLLGEVVAATPGQL